MDDKKIYKFRISDIFVVFSVFMLALFVFFAYFIGNKSVENPKVQIYHNNELLQEFPLDTSEEIIYTVEGVYYNKIVIKDGKVYIESSNCPGTDCVHSGSISKPGRSLVCLPNKVEIRITGTSDADIVVG